MEPTAAKPQTAVSPVQVIPAQATPTQTPKGRVTEVQVTEVQVTDLQVTETPGAGAQVTQAQVTQAVSVQVEEPGLFARLTSTAVDLVEDLTGGVTAVVGNSDGFMKETADVFASGRKTMGELLAILRDALAFSPPLYPNSILGHPWTWLPPHRKTSEYSIVNLRQLDRSLRYLIEASVPALPIQLPEGLPLVGDAVFWRPTEIHFEPDPQNDPYTFPDEAWIFINGIGTNVDLARLNADYLASIFHRPMTIIQNATDSLTMDLFECVLGKSWPVLTEASAKAYPFILNALNNRHKKRVVVLCHSQGTIVMSNVLRALVDPGYREKLNSLLQRLPRFKGEAKILKPLERKRNLSKLEIYAFANCASVMPLAPNVKTERGHFIPWIENFGNEFDLVARCGMLAPKKKERGIQIEGANYVRKGMWGHCLNVHYLFGIHDHLQDPQKHPNPYVLEQGSKVGRPRPRLYDYYAGGVPKPY